MWDEDSASHLALSGSRDGAGARACLVHQGVRGVRVSMVGQVVLLELRVEAEVLLAGLFPALVVD